MTLSGTNLTGTTSVTFGGVAATNVTVVNATTVTATTPVHAAGAVNVVLTNLIGSAALTNGFTYSNVPALSSCGYTDLTIFACAGLNLNAFPNTFIHVQGGLNCTVAAGITPLVTTIQNVTQLQGVTLPLLYSGCNINLCADSTCAGLQSNTVLFGGLLLNKKITLIKK